MCTYEIISNCGDRAYNEDYAGVRQRGNAFCFVLADGLGGHGGGARASSLAAETVLEDFARQGEVQGDYLQGCMQRAQTQLLEEQRREGCPFQMKTTMVVLLADAHAMLWGHIGDSRLYYFKNKRYVQRTADHSVPQMLVTAGEVSENRIRGHADRNRLLRVMGTEWGTHSGCEISGRLQQTGDDAFLLCSDGFWEWIGERKMCSTLRHSKTPGAWLERMEKSVKKSGRAGSMDNYTAIAVFLE